MNGSSASTRGGRGAGGEPARASAARARWAYQVMAIAFMILIVRLLYLQWVDHTRLRELAKENVLREEVLPAIRGVVRDRQGRTLIDSEPSSSVAVDPFDRAFREEGVLDRTLSRLAEIIGVDPELMAEKIASERGRSYLPVHVKRNIDQVTVAYIEEHRELLPGVSIVIEPRRRYVHGKAAAHLLGYVGEIADKEVGVTVEEAMAPAAGRGLDERHGSAGFIGRRYQRGDLIGRSGVEATFEEHLCGLNGVRLIEVNALGRRVDELMPLSGFAKVRPPVAGAEAVLTLDLDLQLAAEAAFPDSLIGALVVLDPRTGGVLAAVSRPAFDPNEFSAGLSGKAWQELESNPAHPLLNRAFRSAYPPGSVFKVVTGSAVLDRNAVGPHEYLKSCVGGYQFGTRFFRCHHVHGPVVFSEAMMVSCDTYFYQAGLRVGIDHLADYARRFGLGQPTGIELSERSGFFPDTAWYDRRFGKGKWSKGLLLNLSIGQGEILTTPLQLAVLMSAISTGNVAVPHVMQSLDGRPLPVPEPRPLELAPAVRSRVVEALERVVMDERGTGKRARVPGVRVAGKTGTAQNPHGEDHAVFAAFAPVEDPQIAVAIIIENVGHGGEFAAPVAGQILRAYFGRGGGELAAGGMAPSATEAD